MRYPRMQTQPRTTVTVPQLNGGVNLCDLPQHVADNQLTACNNVWWHDGALRTRPGLQTVAELGSTFNMQQRISDEETMLMCLKNTDISYQKFWAALVRADGTVEELGNEENCFTASFVETDHYHVFCTHAPKNKEYDWLFFIGNGEITAWNSTTQTWSDVYDDVYVPNTLFNGRGADAPGGNDAVTPEAANLLTQTVRCTFTTDGVSTKYFLPYKDISVQLQSAKLTVRSGGTVRTVESIYGGTFNKALFKGLTPDEAGLSGTNYSTVSINVRLDNTSGELTFTAYGDGNSGSSIDGFVLPESYTEAGNNLEVYLHVFSSDVYNRVINRMTQAVWFGGARGGVKDGAHMVVAGNTERPNLLCWSDVNNPLYFPENNCVYVGDEGNGITALAKQGDLLVIFKEREIYCAQYIEGDVPTMEELEAGVATEITVHKAYFTVTQLHPSIGCDCPDTVRLVNNKLVWLTSDGRVHVLAGANQYSERNVRQASPLIEKALREHTKQEMRAAVAGECEGYYVLIIGNKMYLMDCQTSAFNSFQYYSREETAQKSLPWYVWTLPENRYTCIASTSGAPLIVGGEVQEYNFLGAGKLFRLSGATDDGITIKSSLATKLFDFARVDATKSIDQLYLSVADVDGCRIRVGYVTDRYTADDAYVIECRGDTGGQVLPYRITPNVRLVQRFGITLAAENPMTVAGVTIKYRNQGVVR